MPIPLAVAGGAMVVGGLIKGITSMIGSSISASERRKQEEQARRDQLANRYWSSIGQQGADVASPLFGKVRNDGNTGALVAGIGSLVGDLIQSTPNLAGGGK